MGCVCVRVYVCGSTTVCTCASTTAVCITCVCVCLCVMTQVLAGCLFQELLRGDRLPQDARKRVQDLLRGCDGGSVGELKDSLLKHPEILILAPCVTLQQISPC